MTVVKGKGGDQRLEGARAWYVCNLIREPRNTISPSIGTRTYMGFDSFLQSMQMLAGNTTIM